MEIEKSKCPDCGSDLEDNTFGCCTGCGICQGCYSEPCECLDDDCDCDPE